VDVSCGVSVFFGRWFSTVFLAVPVLVPSKGYVAWSFFTSDFVRRATPSCAQVSVFPSRNFVTWLSQVSVRSCRVFVRSSLGSARPLSDCVGSLSDRHLAQPDLCPIVTWLSLVLVRSCRVSIRLSFYSASLFVWCVAGPIHSVICYSGQVLSLISNVVFLAPF
jgi:hypothetical protein